MTRFLPRSLRKRWLLLLFIALGLSSGIALGLERVWQSSRNSDALLDWRFWVLLCTLLAAIGTLLFLPIDRWLKQLMQVPGRIATSVSSDENPIESPLEEVNTLVQAFLAQRKRSEGEMIELRNFVANASHELRTPLTTLKLRVEALQNGALEDRAVAEKFLDEMQSEIDHLSTMVADLLDLSRIEATAHSIPFSPIDLRRVISEVYAAFRTRAEKANIQLLLESEEALPTIFGVEEQIRRLAYNLIDNAIKYTQNGGWVKIRLYQQPASHRVVLEVEDNGFGIPSDYLPHIFERFYRAEATRPRYGISRGSGLGLAIAKAITDAHRGKITAQSEVGKGSLFRVELPINPPSN
ncbi:MAG: ATP-binding protein [Anaerolineales bacterium]|nr:HAMP domain-containing histidine kinase [Anaerolineales bacterium]MCS7248761.1 HAMP domain-containing histidine kinase [Anaerolineales bacterium]MDW8162574.1 ATP-binding protein [Anaerolineales bacterium]MDW8446334.1 ATP-binding protein [Anaerolineales bacterium]